MLVTCDHARRFWEEGKEWLHISLPKLHPATWSKDILCDHMFLDSERPKIITTMWAIWSSLNSCSHDRGAYDPAHSLKMVKEALVILELPKKLAVILPGHGWRPPEDDVVKINTDGGLSLDAHQGGAGGIARSRVDFLVHGVSPTQGFRNP